MTTDTPVTQQQRPIVKNVYNNAGNAVYGLGLIGAAVYFIQHSPTFWMGVVGLLKAIIWPALVIYKVLGMLQM